MQGKRGSTAGDEMRSASVRLRNSVSSRGGARKWERKMLRGAFRRCGVITAIAFSAAMFISDARFNVAEAQGKPRAEDLACGKELQQLCSGLATLTMGNQWPGTKIPNCLAREKAKLSKRCAARNVRPGPRGACEATVIAYLLQRSCRRIEAPNSEVERGGNETHASMIRAPGLLRSTGCNGVASRLPASLPVPAAFRIGGQAGGVGQPPPVLSLLAVLAVGSAQLESPH